MPGRLTLAAGGGIVELGAASGRLLAMMELYPYFLHIDETDAVVDIEAHLQRDQVDEAIDPVLLASAGA